VWLAIAVALGAAGAFRELRPPAPQLVLGGLTLLVLLAAGLVAPLRRWVSTVDVRALVALHVTRIVAGGWFLVLYGRGELPYAFAVPGGVGDIVVGLLALGLVVAVEPLTVSGRRAYAVWNVLGLIDILYVVATAVRIATRDPEAMARVLPRDEGRLYRLIWQRALASQMAAKELETTTVELRLPLSVLPTWLVPLIIASHVILALRLARSRGHALTRSGGGRAR